MASVSTRPGCRSDTALHRVFDGLGLVLILHEEAHLGILGVHLGDVSHLAVVLMDEIRPRALQDAQKQQQHDGRHPGAGLFVLSLLFLLQQKQQQRDQEEQPRCQIDKLIRDQMRIVQRPAQKAGQQQICRKHNVENDR